MSSKTQQSQPVFERVALATQHHFCGTLRCDELFRCNSHPYPGEKYTCWKNRECLNPVGLQRQPRRKSKIKNIAGHCDTVPNAEITGKEIFNTNRRLLKHSGIHWKGDNPQLHRCRKQTRFSARSIIVEARLRVKLDTPSLHQNTDNTELSHTSYFFSAYCTDFLKSVVGLGQQQPYQDRYESLCQDFRRDHIYSTNPSWTICPALGHSRI